MNAPRRWWLAYVRALDGKEPADALALMRILTGMAALIMVASPVWAGVSELLWLGREHGGLARPMASGHWSLELLGGSSPGLVWTLVTVAIASSIATIVGLGRFLGPLLTLQTLLALRAIHPVHGGYESLVTNALFLLTLSRCTATASLDARLRTGTFRPAVLVPAWPRLVALVQLCLVYVSSGVHKLSAHWLPDGDLSAVYYILHQPYWQARPAPWLADLYPLTQVATAGTLAFELGFAPVVLVAWWLRRARRRRGLPHRLRRDPRLLLVAGGLALHGSIALLMEVGPFFLATLAFYPCLFSGDELARARNAIARARTDLTPAG